MDKQRPLIKYIRTKIPDSLRDSVRRLKKETIIKENITRQPFRTQTSYRSNAQEQEKIEVRNSIFFGGTSKIRKKQEIFTEEVQNSRRLLWNGE